MSARRLAALFFTIVALTCNEQSNAQTVGYADAIDQLARSCARDIVNFCKQTALGGGRIQQCLGQAGVSAGCKNNLSELQALLKKRMAARAAVPRVCDTDIRRMCTGVQAGDGNLMECFYKAKRNVSPACQQAV